jgi:hypothetical protein
MNLSAFSKIMKKYEKVRIVLRTCELQQYIGLRTCSFHFVFFNICSKKSASRGASAAYMRVVDNSYLGTSDEVCSHFESHVLHSKY